MSIGGRLSSERPKQSSSRSIAGEQSSRALLAASDESAKTTTWLTPKLGSTHPLQRLHLELLVVFERAAVVLRLRKRVALGLLALERDRVPFTFARPHLRLMPVRGEVDDEPGARLRRLRPRERPGGQGGRGCRRLREGRRGVELDRVVGGRIARVHGSAQSAQMHAPVVTALHGDVHVNVHERLRERLRLRTSGPCVERDLNKRL